MLIKSETSKVLSYEEKKNQRWVEQFSQISKQANPYPLFHFTIENAIDGNNFNIILDDITRDEHSEATKALENNKASGIDNLPAELFKQGGDMITDKLIELGIDICSSEEVLKEQGKGYIVKYGSLCDCDN